MCSLRNCILYVTIYQSLQSKRIVLFFTTPSMAGYRLWFAMLGNICSWYDFIIFYWTMPETFEKGCSEAIFHLQVSWFPIRKLAYIRPHHISANLISRNYLKTHFIFDLLSVFPSSIFNIWTMEGVHRFDCQTLHLFRIVRLCTFNEYLDQWMVVSIWLIFQFQRRRLWQCRAANYNLS